MNNSSGNNSIFMAVAQLAWNNPYSKVARGTVGFCSAMATGTGVGLVGGLLKQHHMMHAAHMLARKQSQAAAQTFREGWKEINCEN